MRLTIGLLATLLVLSCEEQGSIADAEVTREATESIQSNQGMSGGSSSGAGERSLKVFPFKDTSDVLSLFQKLSIEDVEVEIDGIYSMDDSGEDVLAGEWLMSPANLKNGGGKGGDYPDKAERVRSQDQEFGGFSLREIHQRTT